MYTASSSLFLISLPYNTQVNRNIPCCSLTQDFDSCHSQVNLNESEVPENITLHLQSLAEKV